MTNLAFFKKNKASKIVYAGGPPPEEQISALVEDRYWIVLNTQLLRTCINGTPLCINANAFKHALQTYGPTDGQLPDFRHNKGDAKKQVFHGHLHDDSTTYVLEWAIVDTEQRIMALIGLGTHENYPFRQTPLSTDERRNILLADENIKIIEHTKNKALETKEKVIRTEHNYRHTEAKH